MRKKIAAFIPAWGFFWIGYALGWFIQHGFSWFHPLYSVVMNWSLFFNDWGGLDVWLEVTEENE